MERLNTETLRYRVFRYFMLNTEAIRRSLCVQHKDKKLCVSVSLCLIFPLLLACACSDDKEPDPPTPPPTPIPNTCLVDNKIIISDIADIPEGVTFNKVKAEIQGFEWEVIGTIEGVYNQGEVTLTLPTVFPDGKLCKVVRSDPSDYAGFWPAEETDNADAKVAGLGDIIAYNNDQRVGRIFLTDWSREGSTAGKSFVYYHYTNQDFTLSGYNITPPGQARKSFRYEASFKEGWNAYAEFKESDEGIVTCTTTIPEETPLVWHFETWKY